MAEPRNDAIYVLARGRLAVERNRLTVELEHLVDSGAVNGKVVGGEHAGYGNHMADDASEIFEQEKNLALQRNMQEILDKVERAIHKLDLGTYGVCETCGVIIDPARLEALPYAAHCLPCKQKSVRR
jgi:DnaK suppressor protein